jgi:hypothetical protein
VRIAPLLLLAVACTAPGMRVLHAPPSPSEVGPPGDCRHRDDAPSRLDRLSYRDPTDPIIPDDPPPDPDCVDWRQREQTWRPQRGLPGETVRLVFAGDTGVRARTPDGTEIPEAVGVGPLAVAAAARRACAGTCDGAVFLGDNLYESGVNEPSDTAFLRAFGHAWAWAGPGYFVLGNHDWGTYPILLRDAAHRGPLRARAHRQFRDLRALSTEPGLDLRGDSHFWAVPAGPGALVGLDSNYLVRRCTDGPVGMRCKGDPPLNEDRIPLRELVERLVPDDRPSIVVGHHPWLSHGEHGEAGAYLDAKGITLGRGEGFRQVLDEVVAPASGLYIAGHDHNTQVGRIDADTLSVVVGAAGKTTAPGERTAPAGPEGEAGRRHLPGITHEVFCQLGFAVVTLAPEGLTLDVHTLPHPDPLDPDLRECLEHHAERRPDLAVPTRPTCRRWTHRPGTGWSTGLACDPGDQGDQGDPRATRVEPREPGGRGVDGP